jgi:hypothetical protein
MVPINLTKSLISSFSGRMEEALHSELHIKVEKDRTFDADSFVEAYTTNANFEQQDICYDYAKDFTEYKIEIDHIKAEEYDHKSNEQEELVIVKEFSIYTGNEDEVKTVFPCVKEEYSELR